MKRLLFFSIVLLSISSCAQKVETKPNQNKKEIKNSMDTSKLTNEMVKNAIEALQKGDAKWYSYFTENAVLTDDGRKMDFKKFFADALGHERFKSIDKVENDGKDVYGTFETEKWGSFKTYFKFHINKDGNIEQLDIGQANY